MWTSVVVKVTRRKWDREDNLHSSGLVAFDMFQSPQNETHETPCVYKVLAVHAKTVTENGNLQPGSRF